MAQTTNENTNAVCYRIIHECNGSTYHNQGERICKARDDKSRSEAFVQSKQQHRSGQQAHHETLRSISFESIAVENVNSGGWLLPEYMA